MRYHQVFTMIRVLDETEIGPVWGDWFDSIHEITRSMPPALVRMAKTDAQLTSTNVMDTVIIFKGAYPLRVDAVIFV